MNVLTQTSPIVFTDLHQLELREEQARKIYATISSKVDELWQLFDAAVEDRDTEAKNDLAETAELAEKIKHDAYEDLQLAKASLLAYWQ